MASHAQGTFACFVLALEIPFDATLRIGDPCAVVKEVAVPAAKQTTGVLKGNTPLLHRQANSLCGEAIEKLPAAGLLSFPSWKRIGVSMLKQCVS